MIKAVIFDFGGVLLDDPAAGLITHCALHLGVPFKQFSAIFHKYNELFDTGKLLEDDFWAKVCLELRIAPPRVPSLWGEAFRAIYKEKSSVWKLNDTLRKNGYLTALLSNTEMPVVDYTREHHFEDRFDQLVFSCVEGTRKPGKKLYEITLQKLRVKPEEAVFIDDKPINVDGAKLVGLRAILFENPKQLLSELESHGVKIKPQKKSSRA